MSISTTTYCASSDVQGRLGATAVALRVGSNAPAMTTAIDQASARIDEFLEGRYGAELSNSRWVRNACADLAAVYFCLQLANPPPEAVLIEYDRLIGTGGKGGILERMRRSLANVPDIAALVSGAPRLTNAHIREYPVPHVVAEPARSTDARVPGVRRDDNTDPLRRWSDSWGGW